jgi:phage anti-repressor protein
MITIKENGMVDARELHKFLEVKSHFRNWINEMTDYADLKENKDFRIFLGESIGGRPPVEYDLTIDSAKEICMLAKNQKGKELRRWLISLSNQRQNLELVTVKEAAFAVKVINCLKYVDNQVKAYEMHRNTFVSEHAPSQYIYSEFAKYRSRLVGWDKEKVNEAVKTYIKNNIRYTDAKILKSNMQTQLSAIDPAEAIKIAVLDVLYAKCTDIELAENFAKLCKNLANELEILPEKTNTNNLYRQNESIDSINKLELPNQL